jgi:hypothetical protein
MLLFHDDERDRRTQSVKASNSNATDSDTYHHHSRPPQPKKLPKPFLFNTSIVLPKNGRKQNYGVADYIDDGHVRGSGKTNKNGKTKGSSKKERTVSSKEQKKAEARARKKAEAAVAAFWREQKQAEQKILDGMVENMNENADGSYSMRGENRGNQRTLFPNLCSRTYDRKIQKLKRDLDAMISGGSGCGGANPMLQSLHGDWEVDLVRAWSLI